MRVVRIAARLNSFAPTRAHVPLDSATARLFDAASLANRRLIVPTLPDTAATVTEPLTPALPTFAVQPVVTGVAAASEPAETEARRKASRSPAPAR